MKKFTSTMTANLSKIVYLTVDGKPSSDGNNCPVVLLTYDKWGNRTSEKYTDINGQPMIRKGRRLLRAFSTNTTTTAHARRDSISE